MGITSLPLYPTQLLLNNNLDFPRSLSKERNLRYYSKKLESLAKGIIWEVVIINFLIITLATGSATAVAFSNNSDIKPPVVRDIRSDTLLASLTEPEDINWDEMTPVPEYLEAKKQAEIEKQKKIEAAKEAARKAKAEKEAKIARRNRMAADNSDENPSTADIPEKPASHKKWSKAQVREQLVAACAKYDITGSDKEWIVSAGLKVMWGESRYGPSSVSSSGTYVGICQFGPSWGSRSNRLDPVWSINRFVRVFRDGGASKIRQHWRATL